MGVFALLASMFATVYARAKDCSNGDALFKISSMSFLPDPPVMGQNSTLLLSMNVPAQISGGTATYSATYNFIPLTPSTENLCLTLPSGCPILAGSLDTRSDIPFDKGLSGTLTFKIEWKDTTARPLLCVSVTAKVGNAAKQLAIRRRR